MGTTLSRERAALVVEDDFSTETVVAATEDEEVENRGFRDVKCAARLSHSLYRQRDEGGDVVVLDLTFTSANSSLNEEQKLVVQVLHPLAFEKQFISKTKYLRAHNNYQVDHTSISPTSLLSVMEKERLQLKVSMSEYLEELAGWDSLLRQDHSSLAGWDTSGAQRKSFEATSARKLSNAGISSTIRTKGGKQRSDASSHEVKDANIYPGDIHHSRSASAQDLISTEQEPLAIQILRILAPNALSSSFATKYLLPEGEIPDSRSLILHLMATGRWGSDKNLPNISATFDSDMQASDSSDNVAGLRWLVETNNPKDPVAHHPNLLPLLTILRSSQAIYLCHPSIGTSLRSILQTNCQALGTDLELLFVCYQMFAALAFCHENGIVHGSLSPSCILMQENLKWVWITGFGVPYMPLPVEAEIRSDLSLTPLTRTPNLETVDKNTENIVSQQSDQSLSEDSLILANYGKSSEENNFEISEKDLGELRGLLSAWRAGALSNLDYLLALN